MPASTSFTDSATVLLWYPTLSTVSAPLMAAAIEAAVCMFDIETWGCHLLMGSTHYVAHTLIMQVAASTGSGSGAGPVSGMSMGPVSIQYATTDASTKNGALGSTGAGQQYLALRDSLGSMAVAPGMGLPEVCSWR